MRTGTVPSSSRHCRNSVPAMRKPAASRWQAAPGCTGRTSRSWPAGTAAPLLLSALLDRPLADSAARIAALQANVELMVIAGCALGLSPEGTLVQTRWDSTGMDGAGLAVQLDGFAALAASMSGARPPGNDPGHKEFPMLKNSTSAPSASPRHLLTSPGKETQPASSQPASPIVRAGSRRLPEMELQRLARPDAQASTSAAASSTRPPRNDAPRAPVREMSLRYMADVEAQTDTPVPGRGARLLRQGRNLASRARNLAQSSMAQVRSGAATGAAYAGQAAMAVKDKAVQGYHYTAAKAQQGLGGHQPVHPAKRAGRRGRPAAQPRGRGCLRRPHGAAVADLRHSHLLPRIRDAADLPRHREFQVRPGQPLRHRRHADRRVDGGRPGAHEVAACPHGPRSGSGGQGAISASPTRNGTPCPRRTRQGTKRSSGRIRGA